MQGTDHLLSVSQSLSSQLHRQKMCMHPNGFSQCVDSIPRVQMKGSVRLTCEQNDHEAGDGRGKKNRNIKFAH